MKKIIFTYFILLNSFLYGCATCALMTPMVELDLNLKIKEKTLRNVHVVWNFSDVYSSELIAQYDKNTNGKLDENELKTIQEIKLEYLLPKNMLTLVEYANNDKYTLRQKTDFTNFKLEFINDTLVLSYDVDVNIALGHHSILTFTFEDDEGFFAFAVSNVSTNTSKLDFTQNLYLFTATLFFIYPELEVDNNATSKKETLDSNLTTLRVQEIIIKDQSLEKKPVKESSQQSFLKESMEKIKSLFKSIKDEKSPSTYLFLLFFAYLYGLIHALGPGHGKTLVASYFLSNDKSYSKALIISLAIGVVHTFSAFILTFVIYYLVNTFLAQFLNDTVYYTTKISALIIISIALYLLYKKYKAYQAKNKVYQFSKSPHVDTCACNACKVDEKSTDFALIVSAGIIPCPGTTTIFIFAISLGLFYAGFISALVMSLGMSTVIFISALLSVYVRNKTRTNDSVKKVLEYLSLVIILLLGLFLLIS